MKFVGKALVHTSDEEMKRVVHLLDLAYTLAKEEIAFLKFPALAEAQKRAGAKLGETYVNKHAAKEFTMILGDTMEDDLKKELAESDFFSVLVDGSTDCSVIEKELIFVRFVKYDGKITTRLLSLKEVSHANADGLLDVLITSLLDAGLANYKKHFVGFMSDGASVNFGAKGGLLSKLQNEQQMPWLVGIHCLNHRLELAVKDAFSGTALSEICTLLSNIHSVFERSPKRLRALKDLADVMGEDVQKPARTNGTRWIQHKVRAAKILLKQYGLIIVSLSNITDDPKIKGYVAQMTSFKTLLFLQLFLDLLLPIAKLSEHLQGDSTNLLHAQAALEATLVTLQNTQVHTYSESLASLVNSARAKIVNDELFVEFQSVSLKDIERGLEMLDRNSKDIARKLAHKLSDRFGDVLLHSTSSSCVLKCLKVLDTKAWPKAKEDLIKFGCEELGVVMKHFAVILQDKVDCGEVEGEWLHLKLYVDSHMQHLSAEDCWSSLSQGKAFANVMKVINLLRIFPVSNAVLERCFSTMGKVKTDWRNRLGEKEVEHLIRLKKEGPALGSPEAQSLLQAAAETFFKSKPRRGETAASSQALTQA